MAGITSQGFEKKTFNEVLDEMISEAQNLFGDDIDLRDETFMKQWLVIMAFKESERWDILEDIYNDYSVTQATNISLDYAVKFQGIRRKEAVKSTVDIVFTGDNGIVINSGYIVQTENEIKFETITSNTISGGAVTITCKALIAGADGNVLANTITEVESPLIGLTSVNNTLDADGGLEKESDESLRIRFLESLARGGGSTPDAIRAAVLTLEAVEDCLIFENETDAVVNTIPAHAFKPYVLGGTDLDIQTAIYTVKSVGIESSGTLENIFTDNSGNEITIGFTRPDAIDVWVEVTVTSGGDYPTDGDSQVEQAIIDYIDNLGIGEDVVLFSLSNTIANNVQGVTNLAIQTSLDGVAYSAADITIDGDLTTAVEIAQTDSAKVDVI